MAWRWPTVYLMVVDRHEQTATIEPVPAASEVDLRNIAYTVQMVNAARRRRHDLYGPYLTQGEAPALVSPLALELLVAWD